MAYAPSADVVTVRSKLVATCTAFTVAPGTTAPELSSTVPVRVPRSVCAVAAAAKHRHTTTTCRNLKAGRQRSIAVLLLRHARHRSHAARRLKGNGLCGASWAHRL